MAPSAIAPASRDRPKTPDERSERPTAANPHSAGWRRAIPPHTPSSRTDRRRIRTAPAFHQRYASRMAWVRPLVRRRDPDHGDFKSSGIARAATSRTFPAPPSLRGGPGPPAPNHRIDAIALLPRASPADLY